jgi:hypothetical protein
MNQQQRRSRKRAALVYASVPVGTYRIVLIRDGEFVRTPCRRATPRSRKKTPSTG